MPVFTTATIAATAAVAGAAISGVSMVNQASAQRDASRASREAEAIRRQQMELDNRRRMTELIRTAAAARAQSVSGAVSRGMSITDSSPQGGLGSLLSQAGANVQAQAQNLGLGRQMFDANARLSEARSDAQTWNAIGDFGRTLFSNSQQIGQIGDTIINGKNT